MTITVARPVTHGLNEVNAAHVMRSGTVTAAKYRVFMCLCNFGFYVRYLATGFRLVLEFL
jgi:hypothetical protein